MMGGAVNGKRAAARLLGGGGATEARERVSVTRAVVGYTLLIVLSAVFLTPFAWTVSTSLKSDAQVYSLEVTWIPSPVMWSNYVEAVTAIPFFTYLRNSVMVTALCILGTVLSSTLVAYAFGCLEWPGRDALFVLLLAGMMLPPQVTMIPVFILFCRLGWVDTFAPLVVPAFLGGGAFFVFLLRQFFKTLPKDLFDAARIDGCSAFGMYWRIALPLSRPAVMTVVIFTLNMAWNDFLGPLVYLNSDSKKTLALGLQAFSSETGAEQAELMAISVLMVLPLLIVFFLGQRYFVEGITLTGMKG